MKIYKFHNLTVSNRAPKAGDRVICVNPTHKYYGEIETVSEALVKYKAVDTANWMVIEEEPTEVQPTAATKHTPAPWTLQSGTIHANGIRLAQLRAIDLCAQDKITFEERNANGELIASAPELLEALEGLTEAIALNTNASMNIPAQYIADEINMALIAIRKAKGE